MDYPIKIQVIGLQIFRPVIDVHSEPLRLLVFG